MLKKRFFKILLGLLLSAMLIYLTFRQIDFKKSLELIKNANYFILAFAGILYAFTYVIRSIRYYFMLFPIKKTRAMENFPYTMIGFFSNNVIPLRLGELIRAKITGGRFLVSPSSVLATIIIERMFDAIMFILFFFIIIFFMPFDEFIKKSFYLLAMIFIICLVVFYIMLIREDKVLKKLSEIPMPAIFKSFIFKFFNKFINGLVILQKPAVITKTFIMSAILWTFEALVLVIVAYACGIRLSLLEAIFTVIIIGVGVIIPTAPGCFGAFELLGVLALSSRSIDKDTAFACITIYHLLQLVIISTLGTICLMKTKLSIFDLFKFAKINENDK